MQILRAGVFFGVLAGAGVAGAQAPEGLLRCSALVKDAERLKCYDDAVKGLSADARAVAERREKEAAVAAAAAAAAATRAAQAEAAAKVEKQEQAFGKADAGADERMEELAARLAESFTDSQKRQVFLLDNGQMWRQTEGLPLASTRPGTEVILKRGAMGSHRMVVPGQKRTVKVTRIR